MDELDRDALVAQWSRHHSLRIPYRKWWGGRGRYEPDFLVKLVDESSELREVKGEHLFADRNTSLKLQAGDRYCRTRQMTFRVVTKSAVNPETWQPAIPVVVAETPPAERPQLAEDAYPQSRSPSRGHIAVWVAVAVFLALVLLLALLCGSQ